MDDCQEMIHLDGVDVTVFSVGGYPPTVMIERRPPALLLVGPGNPGFPYLYADFARSLYSDTNIPVWVHSLIGFCKVDDILTDQEICLEEQIKMKKCLLRKYLMGVDLTWIDHSTSCYITLQLLQDPVYNTYISQCYFLMPVLSKPDSISGRLIHYTIHSQILGLGINALIGIFEILPSSFQSELTNGLLYLFRLKNGKLFTPFIKRFICKKSFSMGRDLLSRKVDLNLLSKFADRLHFYCSGSDALLSSSLKRFLLENKQLDVRIQEEGFSHSFFFYESSEMSSLLASWMCKTRKT